jgi:glycosyltransferase involved in cell wall biosynthesis
MHTQSSFLISIIIPAYNRAFLINKTLNSIYNQSYQKWECIVVDDYSTDETLKVLDTYKTKDSRFKIVLNHNKKGAPGARNAGLQHAKGKLIIFFDSDDIMYPNHLENKINVFYKNSDVDVVTSFSHVLNDNHNVIDTFCWITEGDILERLYKGSTYVDTNSALIKSDIFHRHKIIWDENCPSYQEWDLHIELAKVCKYAFIPEFLSGYYKREKDTISSDKFKDLLGRSFILAKHIDGFLSAIGLQNCKSRFWELVNENEDIVKYLKQHGLWNHFFNDAYNEYLTQFMNKRGKTLYYIKNAFRIYKKQT